MCACGAHLWFPKPVSVAAVDWVEWSQSSWHIDFQHRVALSGCGARSGTDCGGPRVGAPTNSVALKLSTICRTRGHAKTKVPYFWHSDVSAPSARKLFFEFEVSLLRNVRLRRTFLISKTRVRRHSCRSRVVAEFVGRRFSALNLS